MRLLSSHEFECDVISSSLECGLGCNAGASVTVYNLAVGTSSHNVSTSQPLSNESVVTRPSSSDVGSLRTATANPIVTSVLIQWLAGMQ